MDREAEKGVHEKIICPHGGRGPGDNFRLPILPAWIQMLIWCHHLNSYKMSFWYVPTHDKMYDRNLLEKLKIIAIAGFEKSTWFSRGSTRGWGVVKTKISYSTFLMYFGFLKLDFGNQIWKFICSYFGKFSGNFSRYFTFFWLF